MPEQHLHIVSFDIPYPANYGGVIDVYYKIRALHSAGVKVHLHCFEYGRSRPPELEKYCHEVHYYRRKTGIWSAISLKPYIVYSRRSEELLENLCRDDFPIIFEGLHCCYYLSHKALRGRVKIYRESNIEHQYYFHLSKAEKNPLRKLYFIISSLKLRRFQRILRFANLMLTVSREDNDYLSKRFNGIRVECLPSFHRDNAVTTLPGKGDFALYQGNLGVSENFKAAGFLITKVFKNSSTRLVIAGMNPPGHLVRAAANSSNVVLIADPSDEKMAELISTAQVNILVSFQPTGLKLKLLCALFNGRFCLVNPNMVAGTDLGQLCEIASTPEDLKQKVDELMQMTIDDNLIRIRKEKLLSRHSNRENCIILMELVSLLTSSTVR
jgi:hypothetical protein